jgi:hypothetical protein
MSTDPERRAYGKLRDIMKRRGGSMTYRRQGYRYGAWKISLNGRARSLSRRGSGDFRRWIGCMSPMLRIQRHGSIIATNSFPTQSGSC